MENDEFDGINRALAAKSSSFSKVVFKSSKLSCATEKIWEQRKSEFKPEVISCIPKEENFDGDSTQANKLKNGFEKSEASKNLFAFDANSGFVFGAKVADRVVSDQKDKTNNDTKIEPQTSTLFHQLAEVAEKIERVGHEETDSERPSTSENLKKSAENVEKTKKSDTPALSLDMEVTTGEEEETNIFHTLCKLHLFDNDSKSWHSRGQAMLRINERKIDNNDIQLRIVGRTSGNQRVILNSKVWADMVLEKVGQKHVRISAVDPNSHLPLVFLINSSEQCTDCMYRILEGHLRNIRINRKRNLIVRNCAEETAVKIPK